MMIMMMMMMTTTTAMTITDNHCGVDEVNDNNDRNDV
jgi:hypothetical protein